MKQLPVISKSTIGFIFSRILASLHLKHDMSYEGDYMVLGEEKPGGYRLADQTWA